MDECSTSRMTGLACSPGPGSVIPPSNPEEQLVKDIKGPMTYFVPVAGGVFALPAGSCSADTLPCAFRYAGRRPRMWSRIRTGSMNSLGRSRRMEKIFIYTQDWMGGADDSIAFGDQRSR